jgi:pilus assembly protein CpaC
MRSRMILVLSFAAALTMTFGTAAGQSERVEPSTAATTTGPVERRANSDGQGASGSIALSGPVLDFPPAQPPGVAQRPGIAQPPVPNPPLPPAARPGANAIPRVIPLEPLPAGDEPAAPAPEPHVINLSTDSTGMVPSHPPVPEARRSKTEVTNDVKNLIESVYAPEAEISVVEGQTKVIQTRRDLTRIVISNPAVADVELLTDQASSRLLNLYGKSFGTTTLTMWDQTNRPVSFLVRVSLDTADLSSRIRQAFPGAEVKVRQVGPQIILDGQAPDSKTMADIIQLVSFTLMSSPSIRAVGGAQMGGGGGGAGGAGAGRGAMLINRITVPGPRQVLLHVKIAEINRTAIRSIGVSWLYARGQSLLGSVVGNSGTINAAANATYTQTSGPLGFVKPVQGTFSETAGAVPAGSSPLFGIFDAGHFSLFINALRTNNLAKILAEPNLVALDGQPARFLVGGMFPFPVPQSSSIPGGTAVVTVQFQRFGTILTFLPEILANDVIRLDVEPVISQLNFAQTTQVGTGTVPSIVERSARTVVELREGQSLAIAGLLQSVTNASTIRIPWLGDLPIVGPWFSANTINTIETETVVLVTPELVSPLDKHEVTEAPGERVYQPSDPEFYLLGRIEGKLGREFRATVGQQDPLNLMKHFQSEQQWVIGPHGYAD